MAESNLPASNPLKLNTSVASQQVHLRSPTAKPPTPVTKTIVERFLTCPICYEIYSHPKCLPCLHTFCYHCLLSYILSREESEMRRKKGFPCPMCKQFHFMKTWNKPLEEWVEEFKNNFMIQNMIDSILPKTKPDTQDTSAPSGGIQSQLSIPAVPQEAVQTYNQDVPQIPNAPQPPTVPLTPTAPPMPVIGQLTEQENVDPSLNLFFRSPLWRTLGDQGLDSRNNSPFGQSYSSSGNLTSQRRTIRPSSSTHDVSQWDDALDTPFNARSPSSSDLSRDEEPVTYVTTYTMKRDNVYPNYHGRSISDVCYLPKATTIVVTDYNTRCVILFRSYFLGNRTSTKIEVPGRPSSVALLNPTEDCVVVNLQNKSQILFISIPKLNILHVLETQHNYQSVAISAFDTLLTGSSVRPARIDRIKLRHGTFAVSSSDCLIENRQHGWTIASPSHICALAEDKFVVSDPIKKSLIGFNIETENGRTVGKKYFSLTPTRDRKFRCLGGMCCNSSPGSFYVVDYGGNAVYRIYPGDTIRCEKVLGERHGIQRPASVCLGPRGVLCVVDWEGSISLYSQMNMPTVTAV